MTTMATRFDRTLGGYGAIALVVILIVLGESIADLLVRAVTR